MPRLPAFPRLRKRTYTDIRAEIADGDILLASGNYVFSNIIKRATKSCWSHVAFVLRVESIDRVMVLESIEDQGVRTIPLSEYVRNFEGTGSGYNGRLAIARHDKFESTVTEKKLRAMSQFAVDRFARPYDKEEIARITARIVGSFLKFPKRDLVRDEEYICSEYVYECYRHIGLPVKYDKRGFVTPADFAKDPNVKFLWEIT